MGKHHGDEPHDLFHPPWVWLEPPADEETIDSGKRADSSPDRGGVPDVQLGDLASGFRLGLGRRTYRGTL